MERKVYIFVYGLDVLRNPAPLIEEQLCLSVSWQYNLTQNVLDYYVVKIIPICYALAAFFNLLKVNGLLLFNLKFEARAQKNHFFR